MMPSTSRAETRPDPGEAVGTAAARAAAGLAVLGVAYTHLTLPTIAKV
jgi:hypothetical protein